MSIRDKYTATKTTTLKKQKEEEDVNFGSSNSEFLPVDDGLNKFRIFPKHEGEESFSHIRAMHWISYEKDGEMKRTNVPNSVVHGETEMDIIEEYIKFARLTLDGSDADEAKKLKSMVSFPSGINRSTSWVVYANKIIKNKSDTFGLLELKKTVRDAMNELSIIEDESEAIEVDPFTDPDEGRCVLITYDSKAKKASDYYKTQLSKNALPLTDEELEKFEKMQPLSKLNFFNYTITHFETALEGVRIYDEENEVNLFETDAFQEIIEEVRAQYDQSAGRDVEDEKKTTKKVAVKETKKVATKKAAVVEEEDPADEEDPEAEEASDVEEGDEYEAMERPDLLRALRGLDAEVKILKSMDDDTLRSMIRERLVTDEDEPEAEETEEAEEEDLPAVKTTKKVGAPVKTAAANSGQPKLSLAEIKAKLNATKKK